jgi:hypothetical protein
MISDGNLLYGIRMNLTLRIRLLPDDRQKAALLCVDGERKRATAILRER